MFIRLSCVCAMCLGLVSVSVAESADFEKATALFQQREWAQAAAAFSEVERKQPGQTDALLFEGKSLVKLSKFDDAGDALQNYLKTHPKSDDANYLLAYIRFRQNRPKESLELMHAAAALKPPTADDFKIGALDYVLMGDYADAGRYLEEAVHVDPNNLEARYHLGRVRYQENRFDDAIAAFRAVLEKDPGNVRAQDNLALCLEGKNQMEEAASAYQKAIELDQKSISHSAQPYLDYGTFLVRTSRPEEGITMLKKAAEIDPKSAPAQYQLGKAYFDLRRYPEAQQATEEAARLAPKDSPTHYLLGRIYQRVNKQELAEQEFKLTEELRQAQESGGMLSGMGRR